MRPLIRVGATHRPVGYRYGDTGLERPQDRRNQLDGGLAGEADAGDIVVQQPLGDVLRSRMDLWPRMTCPLSVVEHGQKVAAAG